MIWIKAPKRRVSVTQTTTYKHYGSVGGISARSVGGEKSLVGSIYAFPEKTHLSAVGVTCENVACICGNVTVEKFGSVCENEIKRGFFFAKIIGHVGFVQQFPVLKTGYFYRQGAFAENGGFVEQKIYFVVSAEIGIFFEKRTAYFVVAYHGVDRTYRSEGRQEGVKFAHILFAGFSVEDIPGQENKVGGQAHYFLRQLAEVCAVIRIMQIGNLTDSYRSTSTDLSL